MCIAIGKMAGADMPTKETLKRCWDNNPDGAGYAFASNGVVYIRKGFMTFDSFWSSISEADRRHNFKNCGVLIHFRIATHGGVIPAMTHPFPIIDDNGALSKLEYVSDYAVVHNGIITLTSTKAYSEKGMSDTAIFIRDYLTKIAQNRQWFRRKCNIELIEKMIDSKMAILNSRGEIIHTSGFTEENGVLYSNSTYKDIRKRYAALSCYSNYDDDEYWDRYYNYSGWNGYNGLYKNGYRDYRNSSTYQTPTYETIPLMLICYGESVQGDMIDEACNDTNKREYAVSKEGFLYYLINEADDSKSFSGYGQEVSLEYLGLGKIYDSGGREKEFVANYYPRKTQFLGDEYPENLLENEDVEIFEDADYSEEEDNSTENNSFVKESESDSSEISDKKE